MHACSVHQGYAVTIRLLALGFYRLAALKDNYKAKRDFGIG